MLFPVEKLLAGQPELLYVSHKETVKDALVHMVENDYSQLPVVDDDGHLTGIISEQAITRAFYHLAGDEISVLDLTVDHCQEQAVTLSLESDLFEALDRLRHTYAVVIVDGRKPIGILTDYDATHFFRDLYEGLLIVEDIEVTLRQIIESVFPTQADLDQTLIVFSGPDRQDETKPRKDFDHMTFGNYIHFVKHEAAWPQFKRIFGSKALFFQYMDQVREIRNQLAHFRGRPDVLQYDILRRARNWLDTRPRIRSAVVVQPEKTETTDVPVARKGQGKYGPLQDWLAAQAEIISPGYDIQRSFQEIEKLLEDDLPPSAREHRAWWSNDPASGRQALAWMRAGWKVESVDFAAGSVNFRRTDTVLYQLFFADLLERLKATRPGITRATKTQPQNWWDFGGGRSGFTFVWTFTEQHTLRVSLDIDTGDKEANERAFDLLQTEKTEIEREIGETLDWERLPDWRSCRISASIPARVTEPPEKREEAKEWALKTTLRFVDTLQPKIKNLNLHETVATEVENNHL